MEGASPFFGPGGVLSRAHEAYEHRAGQEAMARAVARTIHAGGVLMVEAGTGTGKTLAYLVPAIESGRRVIVSTGTRNLQDQIFRQDLPFLAGKAGMRFRASLMKGRDNYLCRYRFEEFVRQPLLESLGERPWIGRIEAWSRETASGDRAEIPDLPDRLLLWRDVNARADTCTGTRCPEYERCWLTVMKRDAEQASVVVVNHHLFFADLAVRGAYGAVLPDYDTVVFDEAHLLEDVATLYFGVQLSAAQIEDLCRDVEKLVAREGEPSRGAAGTARLREAAREFFEPIQGLLGGSAGRMRFDPAERGGPDLDEAGSALGAALEELARQAGREATGGDALEAVERRAEDTRAALARVLARNDPGFVYGMEMRGRGNVVLSAAPIDVSGLLRERLFGRLHACVLTSATLAVDGRFDFFQDRLGLEGVESRIVESPFEPREQAVLYLPREMPEPKHPAFTDRAAAEIARLLEITDGRAFLLFTSYAHLARVREALAAEDRWRLFVQGEGSRAALVESFKSATAGVLLGTSSFWHGVDVPGDALSLVVVDKLPFDVPGDPLIRGRIERIEARGGNAFAEYQVPMAVLELKQGLGRLLRSRSDRGILAVLDPRLTTRPYGRIFLRSLPPYPVVRDAEACRAFLRGQGARG